METPSKLTYNKPKRTVTVCTMDNTTKIINIKDMGFQLSSGKSDKKLNFPTSTKDGSKGTKNLSKSQEPIRDNRNIEETASGKKWKRHTSNFIYFYDYCADCKKL